MSSRLTQSESIPPESLKLQEDAARCAWEKYGIRMLPDAEIRLSRRAFHAQYPEKSPRAFSSPQMDFTIIGYEYGTNPEQTIWEVPSTDVTGCWRELPIMVRATQPTGKPISKW